MRIFCTLLVGCACTSSWFSLNLTSAEPAQPPAGFISLFNGKDLQGWHVVGAKQADSWGVENGTIYIKGSGGGWLYTDKEYSDFELRLEYKLPAKGNSGVALRNPKGGHPSKDGMEIQILDNPWYKENLKGLKTTQWTGAIYGVVPPSKEPKKAVGEWTSMRIVAKGRKVLVEINGEVFVDADLDKHADKLKDHPGIHREKGYLGLQSHDGRVEFRNLFLKTE